MNELIIAKVPDLDWVPDIYRDAFIQETWQTYEFLCDEEAIVSVHEAATQFNNQLMLDIASYIDSAGEDEELYVNEILDAPPEDRKSRTNQILQQNYQSCFDSIADILRHFKAVHCHLTDPAYMREYLLHYSKEVW